MVESLSQKDNLVIAVFTVALRQIQFVPVTYATATMPRRNKTVYPVDAVAAPHQLREQRAVLHDEVVGIITSHHIVDLSAVTAGRCRDRPSVAHSAKKLLWGAIPDSVDPFL